MKRGEKRPLIILSDQALIPLPKDKFAIIDLEDVERCSQHNWCLAGGSGGEQNLYPVSYVNGKKGGQVKLHKFLTGHLCDHRNRDTLDNRRRNLKPNPTRSQQGANRLMPRGKSGFRGVRSSGSRWRAQIRVDSKLIHLGMFATAEEAAKAYDVAAKETWGEFAVTNFRLIKRRRSWVGHSGEDVS